MAADTQPNRTKIRAGLALITVVFLASAIALFTVPDTFAKAIFFSVALLALVRVTLLSRTMRREAREARSSLAA
jgi:hypothetical protein